MGQDIDDIDYPVGKHIALRVSILEFDIVNRPEDEGWSTYQPTAEHPPERPLYVVMTLLKGMK